MNKFETSIIAIILVCVGMTVGMISAQYHTAPYSWMLRAEYSLVGHPLTDSDTYTQKLNLFKQSDKNSKVIMIGDSLTAYADWSSLLKRTDVLNFGIQGDVSYGVLKRIDLDFLKGKQVFLMIGINDISNHVPYAVTVRNIERIIDTLVKYNELYVFSILHTRNDSINIMVDQLNEAARKNCAEKCIYIDLNKTLFPSGIVDESNSNDDVHINNASYLKWASVIQSLIQRN